MTSRVVWFFILIDAIITIDAQVSNCPEASITFHKILGLRPSDSNHPLLLHKSNSSAPLSTECLKQCSANAQCRSFVIYYNVSTCYWFRTSIQGVQELDNIVDMNADWFVKVCLTANNCTKLWVFDAFVGATLVGNDTKILPTPLTRTECQQNCLDETEFECRSAKFKIAPEDYGPNDETRGVCTLSDADRHLIPNAYRASGFDEEYFENQCSQTYIERPNEFCSYEEYDNATLLHSDLSYPNQTKDSCQELCEKTDIFNCRGFTLTNRLCLLHSEDSKGQGPKLLVPNPSGKYYEKTQCINISITCSETYMTVTYSPKTRFMGRMYMEGYSEHPECSARGRELSPVVLKLPVLAQQCGIIKAEARDDRTLMAGTMILQFNPLVQTQGDRTIRVGCVYGNDSKVLIGTGITITTAPSKGSALINSTNTANVPLVEMRVLDLNTQGEVSSTQIGQELQLVIEVKPADGPLDIWAGHLVAMTENSEESILLLDDRGCPTNLNIFPALTKVEDGASKKLTATFQAFKFSSSPIVRFSVIVQFCAQKCPPVNCGNAEGNTGGRRKKREIQTRSLDTIDGTKILNVSRNDFNGVQQMPLEFVMIVRNPSANSDKLVLGDGKILVAGYDYTTDQVCLDYSLFLGLIITWVLIQVIFVVCCLVMVRRYRKHYENENTRQSLEQLHKNFGMGFSNLDRRVHWADNGEYT